MRRICFRPNRDNWLKCLVISASFLKAYFLYSTNAYPRPISEAIQRGAWSVEDNSTWQPMLQRMTIFPILSRLSQSSVVEVHPKLDMYSISRRMLMHLSETIDTVDAVPLSVFLWRKGNTENLLCLHQEMKGNSTIYAEVLAKNIFFLNDTDAWCREYDLWIEIWKRFCEGSHTALDAYVWSRTVWV